MVKQLRSKPKAKWLIGERADDGRASLVVAQPIQITDPAGVSGPY